MDAPRRPPERDDFGGSLVPNLMHFARTLRAAGLPIGPGRVIDAVRAVDAVGITNRTDFYWTLHAVFVNRQEQRELFDQAFHVFWRNPELLEKMMGLLLPNVQRPDDQRDPLSRRVAEALHGKDQHGKERPPEEEIELDAAMTWSDRELLQTMDFEAMSADEIARARSIIARMRLPIMEVPTRRFHADPRGARADLRATLRAALRSGGASIPLKLKDRRLRHPPLVVLCDISGSMSRYSRMLLHFLHALTNDRDRVHTFLFGTRLTNVTRYLRHRDIDLALGRIAEVVEDWSGGTRIGATLHHFNRVWSRRVLGQGAVVLLITDGLDRDAGEGLAQEMERLHKSSRRLIWLNPLLRYEAFAPKSLGMRAIMPHVDEFRPIHNLESLGNLAAALGRPAAANAAEIARWKEAARA
ncbi:MAG: VWA domain-containing protein [Alphaproteobacteria bacterium]|nr:VWA domain-containing protein [Alphaproteobacteria bacterium]